MNENNPNLPKQYRERVQTHLDALNTGVSLELTQIDVAMGYEGTRPIFRLANGAEERVTEALGDTPFSVELLDAMMFFDVPMSAEPVETVVPVEEPKKAKRVAATKTKSSRK